MPFGKNQKEIKHYGGHSGKLNELWLRSENNYRLLCGIKNAFPVESAAAAIGDNPGFLQLVEVQ
jgi:hypothetical protein